MPKEELKGVELDDDGAELDEMAHDTKNAEKQSNDASQKAADAVKKEAPKRKGDKDNGESMEKAEKKPGMQKAAEDVDVDAELDQIMEEEATLSEAFKEKTATLFESALSSKLRSEVERLEEEYAEELKEEKESLRGELVEKLDGFLNHVVETWMEKNEVAVTNNLRTEVAEDFMAGLKSLFEESYIDIPDSKVDLVDNLAEQVESLEEKVNELTELSIGLNEENEFLLKEKIINECAEDLAETQKEKLVSLVEDLDFSDEEAYRKKVNTVKESHFKKGASTKSTITEEDGDDTVDITESNDQMAAYVNAIRRQSKFNK